jgi:predicted Zn finger-like uncharacterized protein
MPEIVTCPNCSRKLRVPDNLLGKTVKCPECKQAFAAQAESAPAENDQADEPPPSKSGDARVSTRRDSAADADERMPLPSLRRPEYGDEDHPAHGPDTDDDINASVGGLVRAGWQKVRLGLAFVITSLYIGFTSLALYLLCLAVAAILVVISGASIFSALTATSPNSANTAGTAASTSLIVAIVIVMIGYVQVGICTLVNIVLQSIAHILYLYIPNKPGTGRRPLAIATTTLFTVIIVLPLMSCGVYLLGIGAAAGSRNAGFWFGGMLFYDCGIFITFLCLIAYFFVLMFFLRSIAQAMGDLSLNRNLLIYMIVVPACIILSIISIIGVVCVGGVAAANAASSANSAGGAASIGTGWVVAVFAVYILIFVIEIGLAIWYLVLLHQVRASITRRLAN